MPNCHKRAQERPMWLMKIAEWLVVSTGTKLLLRKQCNILYWGDFHLKSSSRSLLWAFGSLIVLLLEFVFCCTKRGSLHGQYGHEEGLQRTITLSTYIWHMGIVLRQTWKNVKQLYTWNLHSCYCQYFTAENFSLINTIERDTVLVQSLKPNVGGVLTTVCLPANTITV